ncbi:MAG: hypothetical protein A3J59_04770 [Candidatus Buchananbacteria bacterium RIFCSPHIGHO2_02_FULL_56_16]|uniref:Uncharacterized protein n=1 Tax=Candidatus Buchananbacteria bacterium RIFCSPHIGHO2_02_FULL_56_16 TaxID=1797542 RepID=A0A1G1YEH0_9BACT|nr:MAG: hypothetical protein A3J59_04770 [Candidatus Buchananbacteria bacterium RIFCSPHIGHO2_02_FULL_56_16]
MNKRTLLFFLSGLAAPIALATIAGVIIASGPAGAATVSPTVLCNEYGDSGIDPFRRASIFEVILKTSTKPAQENYIGSDVCIDVTHLREYYCYTIGAADPKPYGYVAGNMLARNTEVTCKNGCSNGACRAETAVTTPATPTVPPVTPTPTTVVKPPVTPTPAPTTNPTVATPPVKRTPVSSPAPKPVAKPVVKKGTGASCNASAQCASGRCLSGRCLWTTQCVNRACTR